MKKVLAIVLLFFCFAATAQNEKYMKVRVFTPLQSDIVNLLSLGISTDGLMVKPESFVVGEFSESEFNMIAVAGYETEILVSDLEAFYTQRNKGVDISKKNFEIKSRRRSINGFQTPSNFKLGSMGGYHTYQELLNELDEMRQLFPELISERMPLGDFNTIEGREVYWVRISSSPNTDNGNPKVLYTALTHAREPASMQQMLYQMWYLLENYSANPEVKYLVDNLQLMFIPCVNPDGYIYNESTNPNGGGMWRKNMRDNGDGSFGVDLNRNFGYKWGYNDVGSSPDGNSMVYRGASAFSEPETQLYKKFCEENDFLLALNNHTYSDVLIYPWGYENLLTDDNEIFREYARLLTSENGYMFGTCYQTLGYTANGGSDDWLYGEQQTKEKIFAFTPEAGKATDGFWPQIERIEEICAGHNEMNLYLARFALPYAKVNDVTLPFISETEYNFNFEIVCLGLDTPSTFTVSLQPISANIQSVGSEVTFNGMRILDREQGTIPVYIQQNVSSGQEVKFAVKVNNGFFVYTDTISKFFGVAETLVDDICSNLDYWESTQWQATSQHYFSEPSSITDSPNGNYAPNTNSEIVLVNEIDLSNSSMAYVEFMARWAIETDWDYVQFSVSTNNGLTWSPLHGKYTTLGNEYQDASRPIYHGYQNEWVKEEVSLNGFVGKNVKLRFRIVTDAEVNDDGFYFDDFKVVKLAGNSTNNNYILNSETNVKVIYLTQQNKVKIEWDNENDFEKIEIFDIHGKLLYNSKVKNNNTCYIPTNQLVKGLYLVKLSGRKVFNSKVLL